ncbi:hypothetical protein D3C86_2127240 [compost metagenome]
MLSDRLHAHDGMHVFEVTSVVERQGRIALSDRIDEFLLRRIAGLTEIIHAQALGIGMRVGRSLAIRRHRAEGKGNAIVR